MKKTLKINLQGNIFNIDDDAYEILKAYLDRLNEHFNKSQEGKEVMKDIELRIAEIIQDRLSKEREVVVVEDIKIVITTLGQPEDIIGEDDEENQTYSAPKAGKRLYRNPENSILAGVSSGIAAYLNIDPWIIRILFILLAFGQGAGVIVYLILWAVLPKAVTRAQKMEMKGENINISSIEQSVKSEYGKVKDNFSSIKQGESYQKFSNGAESVARNIGEVFIALGKAILIIVGVVFLMSGLISFVSVMGVLVFAGTGWDMGFNLEEYFMLNDFMTLPSESASFPFFLFALAIVVGIPLLIMIFIGLKFIFNFKSNNKLVFLTALILWIFGIIFLITTGATTGMGWIDENDYHEVEETKRILTDTLYIKLTDTYSELSGDDFIYIEKGNKRYIKKKGRRGVYGEPWVQVREGEYDYFKVEVSKESKSFSRKKAYKYAESIDYHWYTDSSSLIVDPYFYFDKKSNWRSTRVKLTIYVPENKVVYFGKGVDKFLTSVNNDKDYLPFELGEHFWKMKHNELVKIEKK